MPAKPPRPALTIDAGLVALGDEENGTWWEAGRVGQSRPCWEGPLAGRASGSKHPRQPADRHLCATEVAIWSRAWVTERLCRPMHYAQALASSPARSASSERVL